MEAGLQRNTDLPQLRNRRAQSWGLWKVLGTMKRPAGGVASDEDTEEWFWLPSCICYFYQSQRPASWCRWETRGRTKDQSNEWSVKGGGGLREATVWSSEWLWEPGWVSFLTPGFLILSGRKAGLSIPPRFSSESIQDYFLLCTYVHP